MLRPFFFVRRNFRWPTTRNANVPRRLSHRHRETRKMNRTIGISLGGLILLLVIVALIF